MTLPTFARSVALCLTLGIAGCKSDNPAAPTGPFDLTFTGDASFEGAHGGQEIHVVVLGADGTAVASESSTVAKTGDPAFAFAFPGVLEGGSEYVLDYWIDSNFGGGTPGVCDPSSTDHQWKLTIPAVSGDVTLTDTHRPAETQSVCDDFAYDLTFTGNATFNAPHGGQTLTAALIRTGSNVPGGSAVVAMASTTVSATADPAFSLSFPGALTLGSDYQLAYWIDSNFGGGTPGLCDPKATDHQWLIDLGTAHGDTTVADTHRPTQTTDVCSSFTYSLSFGGDTTFHAPHGGQAIHVAVVNEALGAVVAMDSATVSATADPAFRFGFPNVLVRGVEYHIDYWIDSNFGGGTVGVCDPPANDHQWRIELGAVTGDVAKVDTHRPTETQAVCSTFK